MFCPRSPCLSSARFALGKKPQSVSRRTAKISTPVPGDDLDVRRRAIATVFGRNPRDFLRTIGVSRVERSARRCMVRAPSLQLWAIPRRGEPHNELTILPSISKLALYPCRERTLFTCFLPSFVLFFTCSPRPARDEGGGGYSRGYRRPENNVWRWKKGTSGNPYHGDYALPLAAASIGSIDDDVEVDVAL